MPAGIIYDLAIVTASPEVCNIATIYRLAGGFNLEDANLVSGSKLPPLAPLTVDFATRKVKAVKNVIVQANAAAEATAIRVKKGSLAYIGMFIGNGSKAAEVTGIDATNAAYDLLTVTLATAVVAGGVLMETLGASTNAAAVKAIYTLTIGTVAAADDKITVNGIEYTFAAAAAEGKIAFGTTAITMATNFQEALAADNPTFAVKANGAKLVFTQQVAGVGAIPTIAVTQTGGGTLVASIAETLAGNAGLVAVTTPKNVANALNYASVKVETGATVTAIGQVFEIKEANLSVPISSADKVNLGSRFMFV